MKPECADKITCRGGVMFFIEGAMVTETVYRKHLRSLGLTCRQIDSSLKEWRRVVDDDDD